MGAAAAKHADRLIVTDDNPRGESPESIVAAILDGIGERNAVRVIHDRAEAIATAVREARAGDTVVIAGKGHEDYQIHGRERRHFSDREQAARHVGLELQP